MNIITNIVQFAELHARQAATNDYGNIRVELLCFSNMLPALAGGSVSNAARIDNNKIRLVGGLDSTEPKLFEKFSNLLAFVLIDFAAKRIYGEGFHYVV